MKKLILFIFGVLLMTSCTENYSKSNRKSGWYDLRCNTEI